MLPTNSAPVAAATRPSVVTAPLSPTRTRCHVVTRCGSSLLNSPSSVAHVSAVTDGRTVGGDGLIEAVVRELRDGRPLTHLRVVDTGRRSARRAV